MSWQMLAWASEQRTGSPTRKAVLIALANRTNHETGLCCPGVETLADETELSATAVKTALKVLCEDGFLSRERRRRKDGSLGTYEYAFPMAGAARPGTAADSSPGAGDDPRPGAGESRQNQEEQNQEEPNLRHGELALAYDPRKGTKIDGRNHPWDALVAVTNADETVEKGQIARALKLIRGYVADTLSEQAVAEPAAAEFAITQQIKARARLYRQRWPEVELTPTALAKHWSRVTTPQAAADLDSALDAAQRGIDSARRTA